MILVGTGQTDGIVGALPASHHVKSAESAGIGCILIVFCGTMLLVVVDPGRHVDTAAIGGVG